MRIVAGDLSDRRVIALLDAHTSMARAQTAPGSSHALDLDALRAPDVAFWAVWDDDALLGVGALKRLSPDHGEVKSMYASPAARRQGVGSVLLRHIISAARAKGLSRLSLETGSWDYFKAAHAFYRRHGFVDCPPFGNYRADPNSVFMTVDLRQGASEK